MMLSKAKLALLMKVAARVVWLAVSLLLLVAVAAVVQTNRKDNLAAGV